MSNFAVGLKGKKKESERLEKMQSSKSGTYGHNDIIIIEYGEAYMQSPSFD
jgi:hypothetical protein